MNKYRAVKTTVDNHVFHSKREAAYYGELKILLRAKKISDLKLQPKFPIVYNGVKICTVIGDFEYLENGKWIVVDVKTKGTDTAMSRLKRKLVKAFYESMEWRCVWEDGGYTL